MPNFYFIINSKDEAQRCLFLKKKSVDTIQEMFKSADMASGGVIKSEQGAMAI